MLPHLKQQSMRAVVHSDPAAGDLVYFDFASFNWILGVEVRLADPGQRLYSVRLSIAADEDSGTIQVFQSEPVQAALGHTVIVPFPAPKSYPIPLNSYGINSVSVQYHDGDLVAKDSMGIRLEPSTIGVSVRVVNTEIIPVWIIGARDIALVDDPWMPPQEVVAAQPETVVGN